MRKMIFISEKNKRVLEILDCLKSREQSDFICQAIIEKYDNKEVDIKNQIREVLNEFNFSANIQENINEQKNDKFDDSQEKDNLVDIFENAWNDEE